MTHPEVASALGVEALFGPILATMDDGIAVYDDGRICYANAAAARILGFGSAEALVGTSLEDVLGRVDVGDEAGEVVNTATAPVARLLESGDSYEAVLRFRARATGEERWCRTRGSRIPGTGSRIVFTLRDVTARRRAERAMADSERRYRAVVESCPDGIAIHADGRVLYANPAAAEILGAPSVASLVGSSVLDIVTPEFHDLVRRRLHAASAGAPLPLVEEKFVRVDGSLVDVEVAGSPIDLDGRTAIQVVVRDISARKRAEAQLAAEKQRLAVTLTSIGDGVIATDGAGRVTLLNRAAAELTGISEAAAMGEPIEAILRLVDRQSGGTAENPVREVLRTGLAVEPKASYLLAAPGGDRFVGVRGAPIDDAGHEAGRGGGVVAGAVLALRDVTAQEKLDAELQRDSKLDALGVLAGGLAHDFNNVLTGVLASLSLARLNLPEDHAASRSLASAEMATLRAGELTRQLLAFAKGGAPIRRATALAPLVHEAATRAVSGAHVGLRFDAPDDLSPADVDPAQLRQVVHNLVVNAAEAMPEGGDIHVELRNADVTDNPELPLQPGRYVVLLVRDRGHGISAEVLGRIFDPFFSTRAHGTGLGLATTHAIVRRHGGHVSVWSQPGAGTELRVWLPAARGVPQVLTPEPRRVQGRGRVLVMDDEPMMRDVVQAVLQQAGYEPVVACDGAEAIAQYRTALAAGKRFDAVVLDLTVPDGMGGKQAIRHLREIDPGVRGIVSSGYSDDPVMAEYAAHGFCGVVAKPYTATELCRALERVMAG